VSGNPRRDGAPTIGSCSASTVRKRSARTLERAYDDARGVTARFNKNLLARINRRAPAAHSTRPTSGHRARVVDRGGRVEIGCLPAQL